METEASRADHADQIASAHMISHKSARIAPLELITRNGRRRWTVERKQMIAAQSLAPRASATDAARLHGIGTGQLNNWRKALRAAQPSSAVPGRFARIQVVTAKPLLCSVPESVDHSAIGHAGVA